MNGTGGVPRSTSSLGNTAPVERAETPASECLPGNGAASTGTNGMVVVAGLDARNLPPQPSGSPTEAVQSKPAGTSLPTDVQARLARFAATRQGHQIEPAKSLSSSSQHGDLAAQTALANKLRRATMAKDALEKSESWESQSAASAPYRRETTGMGPRSSSSPNLGLSDPESKDGPELRLATRVQAPISLKRSGSSASLSSNTSQGSQASSTSASSQGARAPKLSDRKLANIRDGITPEKIQQHGNVKVAELEQVLRSPYLREQLLASISQHSGESANFLRIYAQLEEQSAIPGTRPAQLALMGQLLNCTVEEEFHPGRHMPGERIPLPAINVGNVLPGAYAASLARAQAPGSTKEDMDSALSDLNSIRQELLRVVQTMQTGRADLKRDYTSLVLQALEIEKLETRQASGFMSRFRK